MSFRKRNVAINPGGSNIQSSGSPRSPTGNRVPIPRPGTSGNPISLLPPGLRPSPLDGRPTTSTGTSSLDERLAGHGGLALGTSLLLEENGTTDYASILLKNFAAEGLVQGHIVHIMGVGEQWARELPGCVGSEGGQQQDGGRPFKEPSSEKMKIAWSSTVYHCSWKVLSEHFHRNTLLYSTLYILPYI
ncbi:MAG: hypothetical protein M1823_005225 [Watsoniomyces obsoletus]|nr:MAG: hypothetical protein M1823_005225 [Watsoniomyces obsoletus]